MRNFSATTTYFLQEGRENLEDCLKVAFQASKQHRIGKIVIFTSRGEGVRIALQSFCSLPEYSDIQLVAVTFPAGKVFTDSANNSFKAEITSPDLKLFEEHHVPIVRAHLPFDPIKPGIRQQGFLAQDLTAVGDVLSMFCGSMSLCIQSIVLACDAGYVHPGEHVIALTSDTAILAKASFTHNMLSEMIVREILCKPAILTIGRNEIATQPKGKVLVAKKAKTKKTIKKLNKP